ncbi:MAG: anti-sigma factor domain-containing protein [Actinomycetes bacterium]
MPELAPHPHPDLGGYVLGALEPAERADFEEHLAGCERCQAEVAELRGLPELLEQAAPPVEVPPSLRERTFAAVERAAAQQRRRRRLRLALTAAAACLVLVVAFAGGYTLSQVGPFADRGRVIAFALAAPDGGAARATAKVRQVGDGLAITMEVSGLAPNPPGSVYECWYVGPGDSLARPNRVSAGTFTVGVDGRASLRMHSAADLQRYPAMGVTLERDRGNPARTGDKVLVS